MDTAMSSRLRLLIVTLLKPSGRPAGTGFEGMPIQMPATRLRVIRKYATMVVVSLRREGVRRSLAQMAAEWSFDRRHGLSAFLPREIGTRDLVPGFCAADAVQYQGVDPRIAFRVLGALPRGLHSSATFVDYGCGKARGLAVGMLFGFRKLMGVEVCPDLAVIAERNLRRLRDRHPEAQVEIVQQDAARFVPPDGPLVAFLHNPFLGDTLERVAERLGNHARSAPVWVVYINPRGSSAFMRQGFRCRAAWDGERAVLLEADPTGSRQAGS